MKQTLIPHSFCEEALKAYDKFDLKVFTHRCSIPIKLENLAFK